MSEALWHSKEAEGVLRELDVDDRIGLTQIESQQRLAVHGHNELEAARAVSPFALLLRQFRNVLMIVLLAAAGLSAAIREIFDAIVILVIVLFSVLLAFSRNIARSAPWKH